MLELGPGPAIFIRFGIQRKKSFLKDVGRSYEGLVLPANVLLYQYKSTPTAVLMCQKPFFVDPMSYLFGQPYEEFKRRAKQGEPRFKPSFERLMVGHGLTPEAFLPYDYTALLRFLMESRRNVESFTANAMNFQKQRVWTTIQQARELMTEDQRSTLTEEQFRPRFFVPPYFLYAPQAGGAAVTTELNRRVLDYSWQDRSEWGDIFPVIFVQRQHLAPQFRADILNAYRRFDFPGFCVWVDAFDERDASEDDVRGLIGLVAELAAGGRQVVMLYGGFFSMLLFYYGLSCVCHGLAYGESRAIGASAQQGSGPAPIRYYVLELHAFLTLPNALTLLRERPDLLCNCPACRRIVRGDPERVIDYGQEETMAEIHFLWNRNQERRLIAESTLNAAIENLEWTLELNEDIGRITRQYRVNTGFTERPIVDPAYIRNWKNAMSPAAAGL